VITPTSTGGASAAPAGDLEPQPTSKDAARVLRAKRFKYLIRDIKHPFKKIHAKKNKP